LGLIYAKLKIMRLVVLFFFLLAGISSVFAQLAPPQGINYQAVVYDIGGSSMPGVDAYDLVLANKNISVRFTIIQNNPNGNPVYSEVHTTTTDDYGLFSLVIGQGTPLSTSLFPAIDWGTGYYYLKVEIDKDGGNEFVTLSNQQFWSVPYALFANSAGSGIETIVDNGNATITVTYADGTVQTLGPLAWALVGNAGTNDNLNFIGTKDAQDLVIKTNNQERMRVKKNGQVGINAANPDSSAILELSSNQKGFLPPRMTRIERDNIQNPASGLLIFNVTDSLTEYYNGSCWLPTFMTSCTDCLFNLNLPLNSGNIDRVLSDTLAIQVNVDQTTSPDQTISFFAIHNLPTFSSTYFTADTINGDGSTTLIVKTSIFDEPGMYPIAIQAVCGNSVRVKVFYLTIDSCYHVTINSPVSQYNLQQTNNLPGIGQPICVVVDVTSLGAISSTNATAPTFTSGVLDPQSHVGIRNYGSFLARGGNGGLGGNFSAFGNPGQNGGTAINMTTKTSILNYGFIYGGGGGGGSVGLSQSFNIPFLGNWTIAIGAGGGGGCSLGLGGGTGTSIIGIWDNGDDATGGLSAVPGLGGVENVPIPIPLGPVTITVNPNVQGGNGGNYGLPGTIGNLVININATVPIIGTINIPTPAITNFPPAGSAGFAVKKNNNVLVGFPNGTYQLSNLKGTIND